MEAKQRRIRQLLLKWFLANQRELPWRKTKDPYTVWVSEIMLQQTQVQTVIPYFERFIERFPTIESLAASSEDDLLSAWSGLGYYRRARLLHKGVREVVSQYDGKVPCDADSLLSLPGVGRYTAGAIGSIAFDEPRAIVDGNVARVLSRVVGIEAALGSKESERQLWEVAEKLAVGVQPGDFNQSMMELGALICRKAKPLCEACPIRKECFAYKNQRQEQLPVPKQRKPAKKMFYAALVATSGKGRAQKVALLRSEKGLFGGLWSPPMLNSSKELGVFAAECEALRANLSCSAPVYAGRVTHTLSHRKMTVSVFQANRLRLRKGSNAKAIVPSKLDEVGVSALCRKILAVALT